ncbi:MAG TPA: hypothetical protein VJ835_06525 [Fimbriimonadaceae bacterium]|nr:hypothetical protein [Fimbriimonadaceae bacterium]
MKKSLLLAILCAFGLPALSPAQSDLELIAAQLLGDRLGIDWEDIWQIARSPQEDVWDMAPEYVMSEYGDEPYPTVHHLRESGLGWGEIAHRIGMHPGTFNKLRHQGYFDRDEFWDDVCSRRYGVPESELDAIRRRGARNPDVLSTVIICRSSGRKPSEVFDNYRKSHSWNTTAKTYKTSFSNWRKAAKQVKWDRPTSHSSTNKVTKGKSTAAHGKSVKKSSHTKTATSHLTKAKGKSTVQHGKGNQTQTKSKGNSGGAKGKGGGKGHGKGGG